MTDTRPILRQAPGAPSKGPEKVIAKEAAVDPALLSAGQISPCRLAVIISGRGSNMLAIAKACANREVNATIELVISNRPDAAGIKSAQELGLKTAVIDHEAFADRRSFDDAMHDALAKAQPQWVVLAGFMRILTAEFVNRWQGRILNIHPSLLPLYPGLDTHARAIAAGDVEAGASVHIVTAELDNGPVLAQVRVPINSNDDAESLSKRVLAEEHGLYIKALQCCVNGDH